MYFKLFVPLTRGSRKELKMLKQIILCFMVAFTGFANAENNLEQININSQTNHCDNSSCIVKINIATKDTANKNLSNPKLVASEGSLIHADCNMNSCVIISKLKRKNQKLKIFLDLNGEEITIRYDYKLPQHL